MLTKLTDLILMRNQQHTVNEVAPRFTHRGPREARWRQAGLKDPGTVFVCLNTFPHKNFNQIKMPLINTKYIKNYYLFFNLNLVLDNLKR